jgi:hypothetical protein
LILSSTFGFRSTLALNKLLIVGIRVSITWGVTTLPLKRNLIPRFTKGGEKHKNDEGHIDRGEWRISR